MEGVAVPIVFFAMIAAIVIAPRYFKSLERQKLQETLRAAIEKGQPIPPEVVAAMTSDVKASAPPPTSPQRDLRRGVVWLAIAIGLAIMGMVAGITDPDWTYHALAIAAVPGLIGAAFLALYFINREKK